ncbi:MAG: Asp23/Gls24 family envelope stress response protein [Erysipelothrix sp.]|nr:Asp23/Gls24 family envelope stress response protein [Erysipelothrix sp.]
MSTNYVIIENALENAGILAIAKNVFRDIAKETLLEHEYTYLAETMSFSKSIVITYQKDKLVINIDLEVRFGNNVIKIIEDIQKKIHDTILARTSISDVEVNIGVVGFEF